ncbi:MAG: diacylglycerol acyltransferase-domain-containing protein [Monoraphidium minutum]|nr:MAG: diacylglycerol acyltransferase-domain-containing protein [Monoraphidium minutum]
MLPSLGAAVAAWPLAARAEAYTSVWATYALALQGLVAAYCGLLAAAGLLGRPKGLPQRAPGAHAGVMIAVEWIVYACFFAGAGLLQAWVNPSWSDWTYTAHFVGVWWWHLPFLFAFDTYFFFLHRAFHKNKTLFRLFHAAHHEPRVNMSTLTTAYMEPWEGLITTCPIFAALFAATWFGLSRSWWYLFAPIHTALILFTMGHAGYELTFDRALPDLLFNLINPFSGVVLSAANMARPQDHHHHHARPTASFGEFTTFWDDLYGSSAPGQPALPLPMMGLQLLAYGTFWGTISLAWAFPAAAAAAAALCVAVPTRALERALGGRAAGSLSRLGFWDWMRRGYGVEHAPPGAPGAFDLSAAAAAAAAQRAAGARAKAGKRAPLPVLTAVACGSDSGSDCDTEPQRDQEQQPAQQQQQQQQQQQRFVFGYHPQGYLARGAFYTFAAAGGAGPMAQLAAAGGGAKLAVGSWILKVPGVGAALLALGCTDASYANLLRTLTRGEGPAAVAISPGGWREAAHMGSYRLVLTRRLGFVKLAAEAGAALVPVLGVGEPGVTGPGGPGARAMRWIVSYRPRPLKVVFGEPVAPLAGEPLRETQARYVAALMRLAAAHGVELELVE